MRKKIILILILITVNANIIKKDCYPLLIISLFLTGNLTFCVAKMPFKLRYNNLNYFEATSLLILQVLYFFISI